MDKTLFRSLFHVGETIASGNPDNPRCSALLNLVAIKDDCFRYKSINNQDTGKFLYTYISVIVEGFDRIDPFSIKPTIQDVLTTAGLKKNGSTENYAYGFAREIRLRTAKPFLYPGEIVDTEERNLAGDTGTIRAFDEGASIRVLVDRQERSAQARAACLKEQGFTCKVCGFNFEFFYGLIGKAFIHVHHLYPIAMTRERRNVDPSIDLVPLCANCHAMVHTSNPPLTIAALQKLIPSNDGL